MSAIAVDKTNLQELLGNADSMSSSGKPSEALSIYQAVAAKFPQYNEMSSFHTAVGSCHYQLKDIKSALSSFARAGELDPKNTPATINAGTLSKETGDLDSAVRWFLLTLEHDSANTSCLLPLAVTYLAMAPSKCEEAVSILEKMIASSPSSSDVTKQVRAHELRSFAFYKMGRNEEALKDWASVKSLSKIEELSPNQKNIFAANLSVVSMARMNEAKYAEALDICVDVNLLQPNANGWFNQGVRFFFFFFFLLLFIA